MVRYSRARNAYVFGFLDALLIERRTRGAQPGIVVSGNQSRKENKLSSTTKTGKNFIGAFNQFLEFTHEENFRLNGKLERQFESEWATG